MPTPIGKILKGPSGLQLVVTKGGPGELCDGEIPLVPKDSEVIFGGAGGQGPLLQLGKRFRSPDGAVEVLITAPGLADLRYQGTPLEPKEAKPLPSSD